MAKIPLGPWPLGADNVHDEYADVFRAGGEVPPRLVSAVNVDLDAQGWPDRRMPWLHRIAGTAYKTLVEVGGLLLAQDGGIIYRITPPTTRTPLVTGLNAALRVHFWEYGGFVLWTNGETCGKILADGTAKHWGLGVPPSPTLGTTTGGLPAGRYRVAVTYVDSDGAESGAGQAAAVTTDGTEDITVDLTVDDSNATHVNIYISQTDQQEVFWQQQVAVADLPATVEDVRVSQRPLRTQFLRNPIPGDGGFSFKGYTFIFRDNLLFRSRGQVPNLFHPREVFLFPWDVLHGVGLKDGFYVGTSQTLHWISGSTPTEWNNDIVDRAAFAQGGIRFNGEKIPSLKTTEDIALFASSDGLVAGLPDGRIAHLTDQRLELSVQATTASLLYRQSGDIRQVLMLLS